MARRCTNYSHANSGDSMITDERLHALIFYAFSIRNANMAATQMVPSPPPIPIVAEAAEVYDILLELKNLRAGLSADIPAKEDMS